MAERIVKTAVATLLFTSPLRQPIALTVILDAILIVAPFAIAIPVPLGVQPEGVPGVEPSVV